MLSREKLLIFISFLVACIIAEIGLRLSPLVKPQFIAYDADRGWKLRAGASGMQVDEGRAYVRINRWGYRGPDWPLHKAGGVVRIAVIGDSFTEAQQVAEEHTFSSVAGRELASECDLSGKRANHKFEILNFGVDGYGTAQELLALQHDVWKFSPDVVVLAFFAGNDFRNNSVVLEGDQCQPFFVYRNNHMALDGPFDDSDWFRFQCYARFESRHSQLLNLLGSARSRIRGHIRRWEWKEQMRGVPITAHVKRPAWHEAGVNDLIYRPPVNQIWRDAWEVTEAEIEMIHQDVMKHHAVLLVTTLSTGIQVSPDPEVRERYLKAIGGTSLFYPEQQIAAWGEKYEFPVLNLAPPMQAYADAHHAYLHGFPNTKLGTGHWNELGHQVAGEWLADKLKALVGSCNAPFAKSNNTVR